MLIRNRGKHYVIVRDEYYIFGEIWHNYILYTLNTTNIDQAFHFSSVEDAEAWIKRNTTWPKGSYSIVKESDCA